MEPRLYLSAVAVVCYLLVDIANSQGVTSTRGLPIVQDPDASDESEARRLWNDVCQRGFVETGKDGDNFIFCALVTNPPAPIVINHTAIELEKAKSTKGNQIIVIDPPYYTYQHRFVLQGDRASPHKTIVYVRPPKNSHQVELKDDTTAQGNPRKPKIVYLSPEQNQNAEGEGDQQPAPSVTEPVVAPVPEKRDNEVQSDENAEKSSIRTARAPVPLPMPIPVLRQQFPVPIAQPGFGDSSSTVFFQLGSGAEMRYTIGY